MDFSSLMGMFGGGGGAGGGGDSGMSKAAATSSIYAPNTQGSDFTKVLPWIVGGALALAVIGLFLIIRK